MKNKVLKRVLSVLATFLVAQSAFSLGHSYEKSCTNIKLLPGVLTARCGFNKPIDQYHQTGLYIGFCTEDSDIIVNANDQLACSKQKALNSFLKQAVQ